MSQVRIADGKSDFIAIVILAKDLFLGTGTEHRMRFMGHSRDTSDAPLIMIVVYVGKLEKIPNVDRLY